MPRQYTPRVEYTCKRCGKIALRIPSEPRTYCSTECAGNSPNQVEVRCEICGAVFRAKPSHVARGHARFCSRACANKGAVTSVTQVCPGCGKEFSVFQSDLKRRGRTYCSRTCSMKYQERTPSLHQECACLYCGTIFLAKKSRVERGWGKYCSHRCRQKHKTGEANNNWKGGIANTHRGVVYRQQYRDWRQSVFERDDYTCQDCGQRGGVLNAHHVAPWASNPDLRYEISNGITLCYACHRAVHRGTPRPRTSDQIGHF